MLSYNSLMKKKLFLTVVGVVGLTGMGFAGFEEMRPADGFEVGPLTYSPNQNQTDGDETSFDFSGGGWQYYYQNIGSNEYCFERWVDGKHFAVTIEVFSPENIWVSMGAGSNPPNPWSDGPYFEQSGEIRDPNFADFVTHFMMGQNNPLLSEPDFEEYYASILPLEGLGGSGGDEPEATAGAFLEKAQDLNSGLVFQDGQWTPAP
jgi:hypothetical protein